MEITSCSTTGLLDQNLILDDNYESILLHQVGSALLHCHTVFLLTIIVIFFLNKQQLLVGFAFEEVGGIFTKMCLPWSCRGVGPTDGLPRLGYAVM